MKRFLTILIAILLCVLPMVAQSGRSCSDAILLTADYSENIYTTCEKWYVANSYDLPLTVTFRPSDPNAPAPEVEMDFTCVPGQYDDPFLYELFSPENGAYLALPFKPAMSSRVVNGVLEYYIAMGENYRDMLFEIGITYNVEVYVKVTYKSTGQVALTPDAFGDCMDAPWIKRGHTYHVDAGDRDTHYIEPYVQWQDDSIQYTWTGDTELMIAVGKDCMFDPLPGGTGDAQVVDRFRVQPGATFKLSNEDIRYYVQYLKNDAGIFFCKFYSTSAGTVKVEHIPAPPPAGDAVLLEYNKATQIPANSVDTTVFAIPKTWSGGTRFVTPTRHVFKMYVGTTPDFTPAAAIDSFQFSPVGTGHEHCLTEDELADLLGNAADNYLYVRFECTATTTITPRHYTPSDCLTKAVVINPGDEIKLQSSQLYAIRYADWEGGEMILDWKGSAAVNVYVLDTCEGYALSANNAHVVDNFKLSKRSSLTLSEDNIAVWGEVDSEGKVAVDADGYLYLRFSTTALAYMSFATSNEPETDPDCEAVAIDTTVVTYGDSYRWNGKVYRVDGIYIYYGATTLGCDSMVTLHLHFSEGPTGDTTAVACESFEWYGTTYTESAKPTHVFQTEAGLDSTVTLHLTINHSYAVDTTAEVCGEFMWHGTNYTESGDFTYSGTTAAGCDSTVTLHLTVLQPTSSETTISACGSYTWNGKTYTTSGDYTFTGTNTVGCDSVATLHLTILLPTSSETTISACDSYTWNGETYTTSGDYTVTATNAAGCDSVATLHLTINKSYSVDTIATACGEYTWRGTTYTQSGEYPYYGKTVAGCDSTVTLKLTLYEAKQEEVSDTVCGGMTFMGYTWNGKTYNQSGDYTWTGKTEHGCDSVVTLHLVVLDEVITQLTVTTYESAFVWENGKTYTKSTQGFNYLESRNGCDSTVEMTLWVRHLNTDTTRMTVCQNELSVSWQGKTYTETGVYNTDTILDAQQTTWKSRYIYQDTVHVLSLVVNPTYAVDTTVVLCADSYTWPRSGQTYTASGNYPYSTQTAAGCDSTVTLRLTLSHPYAVDTTATACDAFTWHGTTYTSSGDYTYEGQTIAGCDSTVTLHLTIHPSTTSEMTISECGSYTWNSKTYTASGDYTFSTTNAAGCDSVATLHLTILPTYSVDTTAVLCANAFMWPLSGQTYTTSGDYTYNGQTAAGCDSTVVLHLTLSHPTSSETTISECGSYTWNSETYTTSGDYTFTTINAAGCDSVATLHLTILLPTSSETIISECDSYTWNGQTYTTSGDYTFTTTNAAGCDSVATLHLTINKSYSVDTTAALCANAFTWPLSGQTYTTSGDYTYNGQTAAGCDSTVVLHLTLSHPTSSETTISECGSYTWNGQTYATSGDYTFTTINAAGCDSVATLHLTILLSTSSETTISECDSYTWNGQTYTTSGDYTFSTTNAAGCDSVATLHLTILHSTESEETKVVDDEYTWHGTTYTRSGDYVWVGQNKAGCDSTVTLHLTVNPCREMIVSVGNMLVLNHDSVPNFDSYTIAWLRDGLPLQNEHSDRLNVANIGGEYEAMLSRCVGAQCDTVWGCAYHIEGEEAPVILTPEGSITVFPTTMPASRPIVHVKTNSKGYYYLYGVNGKLIANAYYWPENGQLELELPIGRGLYILLFKPEDAEDVNESKSQQVKLLVY